MALGPSVVLSPSTPSRAWQTCPCGFSAPLQPRGCRARLGLRRWHMPCSSFFATFGFAVCGLVSRAAFPKAARWVFGLSFLQVLRGGPLVSRSCEMLVPITVGARGFFPVCRYTSLSRTRQRHCSTVGRPPTSGLASSSSFLVRCSLFLFSPLCSVMWEHQELLDSVVGALCGLHHSDLRDGRFPFLSILHCDVLQGMALPPRMSFHGDGAGPRRRSRCRASACFPQCRVFRSDLAASGPTGTPSQAHSQKRTFFFRTESTTDSVGRSPQA